MKITVNNYTDSEILKIIREWTELTQEEFSTSIGINFYNIRGYEQGKRTYTLKTLRKIAKAHKLKITIEKEK